MTPTLFPPYLVQGYRINQRPAWTTDSTHETLETAIEAAKLFHRNWARKVRVIDQDERVYYRSPA